MPDDAGPLSLFTPPGLNFGGPGLFGGCHIQGNMSTPTHLKLLTLLNVSASKRPLDLDVPGGDFSPHALRRSKSHSAQSSAEPEAKRKKKGVVFGGEIGPSATTLKGKGKGKASEKKAAVVIEEGESTEVDGGLDVEVEESEDDEAGQSATAEDTFNTHFGLEPPFLTAEAIAAADEDEWKSTKTKLDGFGRVVELHAASGAAESSKSAKTRITPQLLTSFNAAHPSPSGALSSAVNILGTYRDFAVHGLDGEADGSEKSISSAKKEAVRAASVLHGLNHVLKSRKKIIRNNEKLAHLAASDDPSADGPDPRDQSFTRPKLLFLLPFRSLALHYVLNHLIPLAPQGTQIENRNPFVSSFGLPKDAGADPLDPAENPGATKQYPLDHLATFKGNSDDNFRIGIKITRKAWRIVMMPANEDKLVQCDILIASPLAIKMAADREEGTDILSSIEVCVADGLDVMAMQNWEYVQYVFANMNKIPNKPHGCDFSRVKPWYLESQAKYVRQTILLSRFETPEIRALFNHHLHNLAGKVRLDAPAAGYNGVLDRVRPGVRQIFERLDGEKAKEAVSELDERFDWFTKKTLPGLLKSAVCRSNTIVVIPSYFDFVRVVNYLRKAELVTFAAISEYSSNQEISRARTSFFKGKKAFLLVTERFHFYRRYKIRGAKTLVFYSLPDHAQYYSEFMSTPFLLSATGKETVEVDEGEVSARVLFSKWDLMKLERIVGTRDARRMITAGGDGKFTFV